MSKTNKFEISSFILDSPSGFLVCGVSVCMCGFVSRLPTGARQLYVHTEMANWQAWDGKGRHCLSPSSTMRWRLYSSLCARMRRDEIAVVRFPLFGIFKKRFSVLWKHTHDFLTMANEIKNHFQKVNCNHIFATTTTTDRLKKGSTI